MTLPVSFDHLEKVSLIKKSSLEEFCLPVKTSCPPAENILETPN